MREPEPPAEVPAGLVARLQDINADTLYTSASYAEALADARSEPDEREEANGGEPVLDDQGDEFPGDVPRRRRSCRRRSTTTGISTTSGARATR